MAPDALDRLLRTCLAKDPEERIQTAHDVKLQLQWIAEGGPHSREAAGVPPARRRWERAGWLVAATFFVMMLAGSAAWWVRMRRTPRTMHFYSPVPFPANDVALSPDGRTLAMVAYSEKENKYVIWTHELGGRLQTPVPGTEDASHPFWSPDGRSIAFFANGKLKKADLSGGLVQVLCDAANGRGGAWSAEGTILFSPDPFSGISRMSSSGGTPVELTKLDASRFESSHRWPVFLPDGRHFLYLADNFSAHVEKIAIFLGSLDSGDRRLIVSARSNVAYADPGYLLYRRDNALVAQRFDSHSYVLSGEPRTVSDEIQYLPQIDLVLFAVSGNGTLVAQTGKGAARSQLTWFDRNGRRTGTVAAPGVLSNPSLSPDGLRVAFDQAEADGRRVGIWIHELTNDAVTRFTFDPSLNQAPVWSPDGKRVAFTSNRMTFNGLYQKIADGSGSEEAIADLGSGQPEQRTCWDWSRDGKYLLAQKAGEPVVRVLPGTAS